VQHRCLQAARRDLETGSPGDTVFAIVCLSTIKSGHIGGAARRELGGKESASPFDGARERRILLQGEMRAREAQKATGHRLEGLLTGSDYGSSPNKNRTFEQQSPAQRSGFAMCCRDTCMAANGISDPLERSRLPRGTRERQSVRRRRDHFFLLEVFFATFLVAAFAVFFAFFAFLTMSSSRKNSLDQHAHAVNRHAQH
jgi:hypothetical protein